MGKFISCDWGTSSLRLRLVDTGTRNILASISGEGIVDAHKRWEQAGANVTGRMVFYQTILSEKIKEIEGKSGLALDGIEMIVSGMASSSIGMKELPYREIPFSLRSPGQLTETIAGSGTFRHVTILVSGLKTSTDAMRGEETQLVGCDLQPGEDKIFVLPGTHSKHVRVTRQTIVDIRTFMTGEFLHLLSTKSILSHSVEKHDDLNLAAFQEGVIHGVKSNLLHESFVIRTKQLFGIMEKRDNYDYLKGLLLGTELKDLLAGHVPITIVSGPLIEREYEAALSILGVEDMTSIDEEQATVRGHLRLLEESKQKSGT